MYCAHWDSHRQLLYRHSRYRLILFFLLPQGKPTESTVNSSQTPVSQNPSLHTMLTTWAVAGPGATWPPQETTRPPRYPATSHLSNILVTFSVVDWAWSNVLFLVDVVYTSGLLRPFLVLMVCEVNWSYRILSFLFLLTTVNGWNLLPIQHCAPELWKQRWILEQVYGNPQWYSLHLFHKLGDTTWS